MYRVQQQGNVGNCEQPPGSHRKFAVVNQEWTTRPERSNVFVIRFIVWFALTLGRRASRGLLFPICFYFIIFSVQARAASRNYLNRALGRRANLRDIFRHYFFFSSTILDRVFLLNAQDTLLDLRLQDQDIFETVVSSAGCILIGAHTVYSTHL